MKLLRLSTLVLLTACGLFAQERMSIAVLDFNGLGISSSEAAMITGRLRLHLKNSQEIELIDKFLVNQILQEQDFQLAGHTSGECAVEVGQLVAASRMIIGSIGKVGSVFSFDIRTIDVETGSIVGSIGRDFRGSLGEILNEVPSIAGDIVAGIKESPVMDGRYANRRSIAMLDLHATGESQVEADIFGGRLETRLVGTGKVIVVDKGHMEQVLNEQDFRLAGHIDTESAVAIGQLLGTTEVVNGSLGKVGSTYSIDLQLIDVATGVIINSLSRSYRGEFDDLLRGTEQLAWELIGYAPPRGVHTTVQLAQSAPTPNMKLETKTATFPPTAIAIIDFKSDGVSEQEARVLTTRLSTHMVQSGHFRVIERIEIQQILAEQDYHLTGLTECTTDECAIEIGKIIGAEQMLAGTFGKIGSTYTIDMRIIDVETTGILRSASYDIQGEIDLVLSEGIAEAVRRITGME